MSFSQQSIFLLLLNFLSSADPTERSLLFEKMTTHITITHDGNVSWFAPVILSSECSIELSNFPFDTQKCPLTFGLWTVPISTVPRINLSLVREYGDTSNYQKNGIFQLNSMLGRTVLTYFPCCPGVPFVRLEYEISIQRRTVYYFIDFFMPTFILDLLLFLSYALPPECGERMTLGISLLLAFVLHMLHVANHIPPTSDAVPMVTKFISASTAFSAVSLIASAVAVKFLLCKKDKTGGFPWFVLALVNDNLARVCCLPKQENSTGLLRNVQRRQSRQQTLFTDKGDSTSVNQCDEAVDTGSGEAEFSQSEPKNHEASNLTKLLTLQPNGSSDENGSSSSILDNFRAIMHTLRDKEFDEHHDQVWRRAICAIDRVACAILLIAMFFTVVSLMFITTSAYLK